MKVAVIGTGYVGLVTGTCLAESGNDVVGIDKDADEDRDAQRQPHSRSTSRACSELVQRNSRDGRLSFTTDLGLGGSLRPV